MITELTIKNYKSTLDTLVPLSAFTVLIGENGAGKSNILESLVLASAAGANKLDTEYLNARGVRLCSSRLTKSAFTSKFQTRPITISVKTDMPGRSGGFENYSFVLLHDDKANQQWTLDPKSKIPMPVPLETLLKTWRENKSDKEMKKAREELLILSQLLSEKFPKSETQSKGAQTTRTAAEADKKGTSITLKSRLVTSMLTGLVQKTAFEHFTVYSPTYETLKNPLATPPTSPIGPKGEGMMVLLQSMQRDEGNRLEDVKKSLGLFGWYSSIQLPTEAIGKIDSVAPRMLIGDRFVRAKGLLLDDTAVNEGFLYVLFYLTIFCSSKTPDVFAIENIDSALNPRLCEVLIKELVLLGKKYKKQAIVTTHNPAVLDALNLDDDKQSLVIIRRDADGQTKADKYQKPVNRGSSIVKLSEAFLRGHIGALPKGI